MAMVPRCDSSLQPRRTGDGNQTGDQSGSTFTMISASDFPVEDNNQNRRILAFLMADMKSSWHPSFTFLAIVIRAIAHCLVAVSSQELAGMKVVCCENGDRSSPRSQWQGWTIRRVADQCRTLCGAAILETQNGMDIICRESGELHGTQGSLNRFLRELLSGNACEKTMMSHIQKARIAHELIVRQQGMLVKKWHDLSRFVSNIRPALNGQLQILESQKVELRKRRTALGKDLETAEAKLRDLKEKESALESNYNDIVSGHDSRVRELRNVKADFRKLKDEIPFLEHTLEELKEDIEINEPELKQDNASEKRRREMIDKGTAEQSLAGTLWSYCWSGVAERQRRAQWDQEVGARTRKLEEQTREIKERKDKIRKSKHELKRLALTRNQLERGTIDEDHADKHDTGMESKIRQLQGEAEKNRSVVKRLKAELEEVELEMRGIDKYEAIVPNLCRDFGKMESHVNFTYNGHRHTLRKLNDYSSKLRDIAQRMASLSNREAGDIIEDTLSLRCHYIVIQFMSSVCGFVCRELYSDGFLAISHLGTDPLPRDGMAGSSPWDIHHQTNRKEIEQLYLQGEQVARGFDNVKAGKQLVGGRTIDKFTQAQHDCFLALRHAISDVVESTPSRPPWSGTGSRLWHWTGRRRRQAIEDWATAVLGHEGDGSTIHELSGGREFDISELPGDENDDIGRR